MGTSEETSEAPGDRPRAALGRTAAAARAQAEAQWPRKVEARRITMDPTGAPSSEGFRVPEFPRGPPFARGGHNFAPPEPAGCSCCLLFASLCSPTAVPPLGTPPLVS